MNSLNRMTEVGSLSASPKMPSNHSLGAYLLIRKTKSFSSLTPSTNGNFFWSELDKRKLSYFQMWTKGSYFLFETFIQCSIKAFKKCLKLQKKSCIHDIIVNVAPKCFRPFSNFSASAASTLLATSAPLVRKYLQWRFYFSQSQIIKVNRSHSVSDSHKITLFTG